MVTKTIGELTVNVNNLEFTAKIHKLGINPCVDVPDEIVSALLREANKKNAPVQVYATLNGTGRFETNLVRYQGAHRLYLNVQMRREVGVDVGNVISVALVYDPERRMPPMPQTLRETLRENNQAMEKWRLQPMSRRKEILQYLNSLKNEESIRRNTSKIVSSLLKPKKARPKASV